jgi:hypothetical protein
MRVMVYNIVKQVGMPGARLQWPGEVGGGTSGARKDGCIDTCGGDA